MCITKSFPHTDTHTHMRGACVGRKKAEESAISQWPGGRHRERNGSYVEHSQHCVVSPNKAFPSPACQRHHCVMRRGSLYHTQIPHTLSTMHILKLRILFFITKFVLKNPIIAMKGLRLLRPVLTGWMLCAERME